MTLVTRVTRDTSGQHIVAEPGEPFVPSHAKVSAEQRVGTAGMSLVSSVVYLVSSVVYCGRGLQTVKQ